MEDMKEKAIVIGPASRSRMQMISAQAQAAMRTADERIQEMVIAFLEANGVTNPQGWILANDFSRIDPPGTPQKPKMKTPELKIPKKSSKKGEKK